MSDYQRIFDYKEEMNRVTQILIFEFFEAMYQAIEDPKFKSFLNSLFLDKIRHIASYFIEYDLDSKGIANLAYYLEEEFKEKFEASCKKKHF